MNIKTSSIGSISRQALAFLCLLTQITAVSVFATETNENHGSFSGSDYKFVCTATRGGMMEVNLGKLAAQKATDPAIQQFAQKMVDDHTKAGDKLQQLVSQKGATVPMGLSPAEQKQTDHLNSLSGTDFDKAYVAMMVKDHKSTVKEFEHASKHADDSDLKSFAASTLPTLQEHLRMIEGLKSGNKVASADTMK